MSRIINPICHKIWAQIWFGPWFLQNLSNLWTMKIKKRKTKTAVYFESSASFISGTYPNYWWTQPFELSKRYRLILKQNSAANDVICLNTDHECPHQVCNTLKDPFPGKCLCKFLLFLFFFKLLEMWSTSYDEDIYRLVHYPLWRFFITYKTKALLTLYMVFKCSTYLSSSTQGLRAFT